MDIEKSNEQLWHRLENEPRRAFEAFQTYLSLPRGSRTVVEAYRRHVDNPQATKVSDTWARWSRDFAWPLRAEAHDAYLDRIRERSVEKAVEAEVEVQAREAEKIRGRLNELLAVTYDRVFEYFESGDFLSQMRPRDVIDIIKLHFEVVEKQGGFSPPQQDNDLTEDELAELDRIMGEIDAEEAHAEPEWGSDEGEEGPEDAKGGQG